MRSIDRILDAAGNRAREALRVMEDVARFALDDAALSAALKEARHELTAITRALDASLTGRDVTRDVGTQHTTDEETHRASMRDVVTAAGKRLSEALRSIEEFGKINAPATAERAKQLRYRSYDLAQQLVERLRNPRPQRWRVCVLLSSDLRPEVDWRDLYERILTCGADCIQLREKALDDRTLLERAQFLIDRRPDDLDIIINDRPDIALVAGADGVHLGQTDLPCAKVRRMVGSRLIIGVSTANLEQAERAWRNGADYGGVGPMFPSTTKTKPTLAGPAYLREYAAWGKLPHLAISGITPENVETLTAVGGCAVAVSAAVVAADDPATVVGALRSKLEASESTSTDTPPSTVTS